MALVSEEKKREIRDRVRLEDLARDYHIILQVAGSRLKALCPFHREKTPSFYVNPELQFFNCFGCDARGDAFDLVQKMENVTFPESLELLARKAGVTLDYESSGRGRAGGGKVVLQEWLACAEVFYHRLLLDDPRGEPARRYLDARGIHRETWKTFRLGYSLPDWDAFLKFAVARGARPEILENAGLVRARPQSGGASRGGHYDYFRGRVMFPIADGLKRVIGFGARTLGDDQPKYLNTPKTLLFDKSQVLYGLPQSREAIGKRESLVIVEGYTDVIMAHQAGLKYFVASLGTAFTRQNAQQLRRLAPRVELIFDGDSAGQGAAERSLDLLVGEDLDVRVYTVSAGQDPCDALVALGGTEFERRLAQDAVGIFEFKWRRTVGALDEAEPKQHGAAATSRALDEVLDLLTKVPNSVTQQLYVKECAERLRVSEENILKQLSKKKARGVRPPEGRRPRGSASELKSEYGGGDADPTATPSDAASGATVGKRSIEAPSLEEVILECLLSDPARASDRWQELPSDFSFEEPELKRIAAAIEVQLREGALDVNRLLGSFVAISEAKDALMRALGRIEQFRQEREASASNPDGARASARSLIQRKYSLIAPDNDEKWKRCMKEAERLAVTRRRRQVLARKTHLRNQGRSDEVRAAERESIEVIKQELLGKNLGKSPSGAKPGV